MMNFMNLSADHLPPLSDRGPLKVMFLITSMPVGGAETLLVNLVRRLDRNHFSPELCCLKELGPLGEELAREIPTHHHLLRHKFDLRILPRLTKLLKQRQIDAVVTVGAGDKMFWGRLAAWRAGVPVVLSALHSTGWPDGIGRLNRLLTPITDGFIGVAAEHGRFLTEEEKFPAEKVHVISNGVDVQRFCARGLARETVRRELGIPADAPVVGIVAALRPEKNHELFITTAAVVRHEVPAARFVIVGDGPERTKLADQVKRTSLGDRVLFLGSRPDIPEILSALDVFALTSHIEANPVSILEAMSVGLPIVATNVGSIAETVDHGVTGYLALPGDAADIARYWAKLCQEPRTAQSMGRLGRSRVESNWSLEKMVQGYESLIREIYQGKCGDVQADSSPAPSAEACKNAKEVQRHKETNGDTVTSVK